MHDLDRQQLEHEQERLLDEHETGELTEAQEMELASQFLEIASEEELEEFLGDLFQRAKAAAGDVYAAAGRAYNSDLVQQQVIPALKTAARTYGPGVLGGIAERYAPGTGKQVSAGAKLLADRWLREELEGLSGEDREFEIARRYVRFAIEALHRALRVPARVPAPVAARIVVSDAARSHVPGLVPHVPALLAATPGAGPSNGGPRGAGRFEGGPSSTGRWVRQGSSVVIDLG
jgi:hypothetical protein